MTFDPFSYPGPSSSGARFRDPAVGGGRDGRGDRRDRGRQGPAAPGGRWGDARPQAHRDPIAWAYDPSAQEGCDSHSRVDRPRAADYAAVVATGRSDFPNQINNVLAFPGLFRGLLDTGITDISTELLRPRGRAHRGRTR